MGGVPPSYEGRLGFIIGGKHCSAPNCTMCGETIPGFHAVSAANCRRVNCVCPKLLVHARWLFDCTAMFCEHNSFITSNSYCTAGSISLAGVGGCISAARRPTASCVVPKDAIHCLWPSACSAYGFSHIFDNASKFRCTVRSVATRWLAFWSTSATSFRTTSLVCPRSSTEWR